MDIFVPHLKKTLQENETIETTITSSQPFNLPVKIVFPKYEEEIKVIFL